MKKIIAVAALAAAYASYAYACDMDWVHLNKFGDVVIDTHCGANTREHCEAHAKSYGEGSYCVKK